MTALDARTERFPTDERITWVHQDLPRRLRPDCLHVDVGITYPDDRLAERVEEDGYRGRLYGEHLESPLASWVNESSCWRDLDSFYRMLTDYGYPVALAL